MPRGPKGEKRPAYVNARAVMIARIATGEVEDAPEDDGKDPAARELGKKGGAALRRCLQNQGRTSPRRPQINGGAKILKSLFLGQFLF
jgi:hypothetical protein